MKHRTVVALIALVLLVIPFFWLKPGEMDLGGDSNRLFFYAPIDYLKASLYGVPQVGLVHEITEPRYFYLPYVSLIAVLRFFFSPTAVISLFNGLKLSMSFVMIYLIVFDLLRGVVDRDGRRSRYLAAILAALFYVVAMGSLNMEFYWSTAITSHNQVFLNPLFFYLLYKFLQVNKDVYLWLAVLLSFIFAPNFSLSAAPPFFAFYPLALAFLLLYTKLFSPKGILWAGLFKGLFLFIGVHSFQYFPLIVSLFDQNSFSSSRVFDKQLIVSAGVSYFMALRSQGKAVLNILVPSGYTGFQWTSIVMPLLVLAGYFFNRKVRKKHLLVSIFFIITLFLATANITNIGYELYRRLFYLPGFSMFRVYYTQWLYAYIFFYSLTLGFSVYSLMTVLKVRYKYILCFIVLGLTIVSGYRLFTGSLVNQAVIRGSRQIPLVFKMDKRYEKALAFIRTLPEDGKFLFLPLTDFYFQVISGESGGAYMGPSMLLHLTDKYSFVGYQDLYPYSEDIMKYVKEKDYYRMLRIFTTLNIRYIFHNTDPSAYESGFTPGPFGYMMTSLPKTQKEYQDFLTYFPLKVIYTNGPYTIYQIDQSVYNPTIFIPVGVYQSGELNFDTKFIHWAFIDKQICDALSTQTFCQASQYLQPKARTSYKMINPTVYAVNIHLEEPLDQLLLVMQHKYHNGWKLEINGKYLSDDKHIEVNSYANGWILDKKDLSGSQDFVLYIIFDTYKYFVYGSVVTTGFLAVLIILLVRSLVKKRYENN